MDGGLELRDLETMNKAMIPKNIWRIVTDEEAVWVQILRAKYFPFSSFWKSNRTDPCTRLWRAMIHNKPIMAAHTRWVLGNGAKCRIFGQPWFRNWQTGIQTVRAHAQLKVVSLFNSNLQMWDMNKLTEFFGNHLAREIKEEHRGKILYPGIEDRCMFVWAQNGEFSVKKAYQMISLLQPLIGLMPNDETRTVWKQIWKAENVLPKIKMFFWRVLNKALPTSSEIARRIPAVQPTCRICNALQEDVIHAIFQCPHARATWFLSPLCLHTDNILQGAGIEVLATLWKDLQPSQIALFMSLAWQIWKSRCSHIFNNEKCDPELTLRRMWLSQQQVPIPAPTSTKRSIAPALILQRESESPSCYCWCDGSYDQLGREGATFLLEHQQELVRYELQSFENGTSPFHMEVKAVLMAIEETVRLQIQFCTFYTDSELLVKTLQSRQGAHAIYTVDWRSYTELAHITNFLKANRGFHCEFKTREENQKAHHLANLARSEQFSYNGFTYPLFSDL